MHRQGGFTLIELMIASTLSLMITAAMLNFFLSHQSTHQHHMGLSRLQENARFLHTYLGDELRLAGHTGCPVPIGSIVSTLTSTGDPWNYHNYPLGVSAHRYNSFSRSWEPPMGVSALMPVNLTHVHPKSDVLIIRRVNSSSITTAPGDISPMPSSPPFAELKPEIARAIAIDKPTGRVFLWSDCKQRATLFTLCKINGPARYRRIHFDGGNRCQPSNVLDSAHFTQLLHDIESVPGMLGTVQANVYYLNQTMELVESRYDGQGGYDTQPLVRGVASFKVSLVEATQPELDYLNEAADNEAVAQHEVRYTHRAPPEVIRWDQLTALRIDYLLSDSELTPPLTQQVSQDIALRNVGAFNGAPP